MLLAITTPLGGLLMALIMPTLLRLLGVSIP
jgi:hypothetical protein